MNPEIYHHHHINEFKENIVSVCTPSPLKRKKSNSNLNSPSPKKPKTLKVIDQNTRSISKKLFEVKKVSIDSLIEQIKQSTSQQPRFIYEQFLQIIQCDRFNDFVVNDQTHIISLVLQICQNPELTPEKKCAELGIVYYYVACKENIVIGLVSPLAFRINQLSTEANSLKLDHKKHCPKNLQDTLPSGTTAYLLRAFVRMIFPPDGGFNPGGCYALQFMMETRLKLFITEETRVQILSITNSLLQDESFRNLFKDPFTVHSDLEELIRIDMQIANTAPLSFIFVRWDLLLALFTPIIQHKEGNCYVIAPTINLINVHTHYSLQLLIDALKRGHLVFEKNNISALNLLDSHEKYEYDFKELIGSKNTHITAFQVAKSCTPSIDTEMQNENTNDVTLQAYLEAHFGNDQEYAKQIFLSLKQNLLQKLLIAILRFTALNIASEHSEKNHFLNEILDNIEDSQKSNEEAFSDTFENLLDDFNDAIYKTLYLKDHTNWNFAQHILAPFIHNENHLNNSAVKLERRLCILDDKGKLQPINKISTLKNYFTSTAFSICPQKQSETFISEFNGLINYLESSSFTNFIVNLMVENNKKKEIDLEARIYEEADSFFMIQTGADYDFLYKINSQEPMYQPHIRFTSNSISDYFIQVCHQISLKEKSNPNFFKNQNSYIITASYSHVFNLYPAFFKKFWKNNTKNFVQHYILDKSKKVEFFSKEKKLRALTYLVGNEKANSYYKGLTSPNLGIVNFAKEIKNRLPPELKNKFSNTLHYVVDQLPTQELNQKLRIILDKLVKEDHPSLTEIKKYLTKKLENKPFCTPQKGAYWIHKSLLRSDTPLFITYEKIERRIRKHFNKPAVIILGNLNWIDRFNEKPNYVYLGIRYDFVTKNLQFIKRNNFKDNALQATISNSILKETELNFVSQG